MSSLVVTTGGTTYERVDPSDLESLIIDFNENPDPELNPDIVSIITPSVDKGYKPEDRNALLRSIDIPTEVHSSRENKYNIPINSHVDFDHEKKKIELKEEIIKNTGLCAEEEQQWCIDDTEGGFYGDNLLFKMEVSGGFDDGFEGSVMGDYFEF